MQYLCSESQSLKKGRFLHSIHKVMHNLCVQIKKPCNTNEITQYFTIHGLDKRTSEQILKGAELQPMLIVHPIHKQVKSDCSLT